MIGILLDVSGSMRRSVGDGIDENGGPWARSIFEVINNFIKHDVSSDNHVFAIGFGADRPGEEIFDIIGTLQQPVTLDHIKMIFDILERAGAHTIRQWAEVEVVRSVLTDYMAVLFLKKSQSDQAFLQKFVQEILPPACRDWPKDDQAWQKIVGYVGAGIGIAFMTGGIGLMVGGPAVAALYNLKGVFPEAAGSAYAWGVTKFKKATKEDIKEVVKNAKPHLVEKREGYFGENDDYCICQLKKVEEDSIFNVQDTSDVVHGYVDEKEISEEWSGELLRSVEPYIYGGTPLYQAIERATEVFEKNASKFSNHKKLLFVMSDGEPADGKATEDTRVDRVRSRLEKKADVTIISCFITESKETNPRRLYSEMKPDWDKAAKFLFRLSSKVPTQSLPRTFFVKRGWSIEIINNETHLFLQVNHPDHMREACQLARKVVCSQDALSDLLVSVKLDVYINQTLEGYKRKEMQDGETCYANAAATVLHLAMSRILGRQGGYPDFDKLRQELIDCSERKGTTSTLYVLQEICPKYHLRCKNVDLKGAMEAITSSRPVVARFRLTEYEWEKFEDFFKRNPEGILTKEEFDVTARPLDVPTDGHAVVLTSFNSECLRLLNSWGDKWADKGFFRVQNADVLGLDFIDVFWEEEDLTAEEKAYYKNHGSEVAKKLMDLLPSLQRAEYTCPNNDCKMTSPVVEFTGTLLRAKCPKCEHEFSTNDANRGNILALNIYLTSLSN